MTSDDEQKNTSVWPNLLGLQVIIDNTYTAVSSYSFCSNK